MDRATRAFWLVPLRVRGRAAIESWLEQMADRGWVAEHLGLLSAVRMVLVRREPPVRYRYALDPRRYPDAREDSSLADAGWEDVGTLAGRDVWRMSYEGERLDFPYGG